MASKKTASQAEQPKRSRKKITRDNDTLSSLLWGNDFSFGGLSHSIASAVPATLPSTRRKSVKTTTRKTTCSEQTTKPGSTTENPVAGKALEKKKVSSATKSSETAVEVNDGEANGRSELEKQTPTSSLHDVKILVDENSKLALLQLRESFKEVLEPLKSLGELMEKIDRMAVEVQKMGNDLRNLRNTMDDSLEELKQSIRHSDVSKQM